MQFMSGVALPGNPEQRVDGLNTGCQPLVMQRGSEKRKSGPGVEMLVKVAHRTEYVFQHQCRYSNLDERGPS